jgi:hypothetical protein
MHEGYHADDIFIMVEDEFQAVAQTFTRHLHHAEYVRMKKKVRAAPPPAVSQPLQGMRAEINKRLEMKDLHDRQNIAVKSVIDGAGRASPDNEKEAQLNDPWQGTSLAGLMVKDSTQNRMALVGLEQMPSTTRAANGFNRGEGDSPTKWQENRSVLEIYGGKNKGGRTTSLIIDSLTEEADEDDDDDDDDDGDDLGGPPRTNAVSKSGKLWSLETEKALDKKLHVDPAQPSNTLNVFPSPHHSRPENGTKAKFCSNSLQPSSKLSSHSLRRKIDSFDDFNDEDTDQFSTRSRSDFSSSSKTRPKGKSAKEKENRSRLNEIPTFLV